MIVKELKRSTIGTDLINELNKTSLLLQGKTKAVTLIQKYTGHAGPGGGIFAFKIKKTLTAICAAGLGNRICTLIGAHFWAKKLNYNLQIYWDIDTCCACKYTSLFESSIDLLVSKNNFYKNFITNLNQQAGVYPEHSCHSLDDILLHDAADFSHLNEKLADYDTIFYNESRVSDYIGENNIADALSLFKIKSNIIKRVNTFNSTNSIDRDTIGLHIRKIDLPEIESGRFFIPLEHYDEIIKSNKDKQVFICSDSKEIEERYKKFSNVRVNDKETRATYDERDNITYRDEQFVIDGFVDMLILSRTTIHPLSLTLSSFCKAASYYTNVNIN